MFLSLLSLSLLLSTAAAAADPLSYSCNSTTNYNSAMGTANLNRLTSILSNTAPPIGFGIGSIGRNADKIFGLALCRGDVNSSVCRSCIRSASARIRHFCARSTNAVIWFDECLFRYSDAEFFGEVDDEHWFSLRSVTNATGDFHADVMETMDWLRKKAYLSPLLFATRAKEGLYGLAQCSRDLSGGDCNKCLRKAVAELVGCRGGKRGGRVVGGSCYVRYELYPFFHA